jgi:hypothetical protein
MNLRRDGTSVRYPSGATVGFGCNLLAGCYLSPPPAPRGRRKLTRSTLHSRPCSSRLEIFVSDRGWPKCCSRSRSFCREVLTYGSLAQTPDSRGRTDAPTTSPYPLFYLFHLFRFRCLPESPRTRTHKILKSSIPSHPFGAATCIS